MPNQAIVGQVHGTNNVNQIAREGTSFYEDGVYLWTGAHVKMNSSSSWSKLDSPSVMINAHRILRYIFHEAFCPFHEENVHVLLQSNAYNTKLKLNKGYR